MTKPNADLTTSLPASDLGSAAPWDSKRINPWPQSCLCLTWSGFHSCETALTHIHNDLLSGDCYDCKQHQFGLHNSLLMLLVLMLILVLHLIL